MNDLRHGPDENGFTVGDWYPIRRERVGYAEWAICWSPDGERIADIVYEEADARLMAASKALYAALDGLLFSIALAGENGAPGSIAIMDAMDAMTRAKGARPIFPRVPAA